MTKVDLTKEQLEQHLAEQLYFLKASAEAFDRGNRVEAKRLAATVRTLCHDTKNSHSLLGQLGLLAKDFVDSSDDKHPLNLAPTTGLIAMRIGWFGMLFFAPLDKHNKIDNRLPFDPWWNKIILAEGVNGNGVNITRRDLILRAANQDGGSHVDPKIDSFYQQLKSGELFPFQSMNERGVSAVLDVEACSIRQIAHEVIKTLDPSYTALPPEDADGWYPPGFQPPED